MKHQNGINQIAAFISKMKNEGLPSPVIDTFAHYYDEVLKGETGLIYGSDIRPVGSSEIETYDKIIKYGQFGINVFPQTVRIVLNGGLGTSMGLMGAKSLIKIKDGMSFLDIIMRQAENSEVALAFMNSFNTHDDTMATLKKLKPSKFPINFLQHKFPKILQHD